MFLVVGGFNNDYIDTTELFISGEWTTVGPLLPTMRPWQGLVTIANTVYIAGREHYSNLKYFVKNINICMHRWEGNGWRRRNLGEK